MIAVQVHSFTAEKSSFWITTVKQALNKQYYKDNDRGEKDMTLVQKTDGKKLKRTMDMRILAVIPC